MIWSFGKRIKTYSQRVYVPDLYMAALSGNNINQEIVRSMTQKFIEEGAMEIEWHRDPATHGSIYKCKVHLIK